MLNKLGGVVALAAVVGFAGVVAGQQSGAPRPGTTTRQGDTPAVRVAEKPADLSEMLEPIRIKAELPGMAAVVVQGRKVVAQGFSGVRKNGKATPVTINDQWHLGSCTKSMTGTLVGLLVEEGKLRWTSSIGEVFPELEAKMDPAWSSVTVEQLLAHRGGAPNKLDRDGLWSKLCERQGTPREQRTRLLLGVLKHPPEHAPGSEFEYSNAGIAIVGAMAEKVTGKAWEDLMRERVFGPLGMTSAGFGAPGKRGRVDQPWGHRPDGSGVPPGSLADNPAAIGPAGTAHCSILDWAKYAAIHAGGERADRGEGEWLLKPETFAKLHTAYDAKGTKYGGGWGIGEREWAKGPGGTGKVLSHSGSNTIWYCVVWIAPEKDMAILVTTNKAGDKAAKACDDVASEVIKKYVETEK